MATVNMIQGGSVAGLAWTPSAQPGIVSVRLRGADAATTKGSALAASDVIQVLTIPAGTVLAGATLYVRTADTGTTLTMDLGDGTAADEWVDGVDATATGYAAQGTNGIFDQRKLYTSADTLKITIATLSSANDDWEVEVLAQFVDYSGNPRARAAKDNP